MAGPGVKGNGTPSQGAAEQQAVPTLHRERGYVFRFRAVDRGEPPHVHVRGNGGEGKLWLSPNVQVAYGRRYTAVQINEIVRITERKQDDFLAAWRRFFA